MRTAILMVLTGLLAACGAGTTVAPSGHQTPQGAQVRTSVTSPGFNAVGDVTTAGLQIHTSGVQCGAFLLLGDPHASYTQQQIQAIAKYTENMGPDHLLDIDIIAHTFRIWYRTIRGGQPYHAIPYSPSNDGLPSTLQWAPGGESCFGQLEVTNATANSLVISSIGASLLQDATPNTINYQLLDVCTLPGHVCNPPGGAAPGCQYVASVGLLGGVRGGHVDAPLEQHQTGVDSGTGPCVTPLTLGSHQSQEISLVFSSQPQHLNYHVGLTITVNGTRYSLPAALAQSLAFIDDTSAFSCYAYQNGGFVVEQPIPLDYSNEFTRYCV